MTEYLTTYIFAMKFKRILRTERIGWCPCEYTQIRSVTTIRLVHIDTIHGAATYSVCNGYFIYCKRIIQHIIIFIHGKTFILNLPYSLVQQLREDVLHEAIFMFCSLLFWWKIKCCAIYQEYQELKVLLFCL